MDIEVVDINEIKTQENVNKLKKFVNVNTNIYPSKANGFADYVKQITSSSQKLKNTKSGGNHETY